VAAVVLSPVTDLALTGGSFERGQKRTRTSSSLKLPDLCVSTWAETDPKKSPSLAPLWEI